LSRRRELDLVEPEAYVPLASRANLYPRGPFVANLAGCFWRALNPEFAVLARSPKQSVYPSSTDRALNKVEILVPLGCDSR
jgi:hypothetical protein